MILMALHLTIVYKPCINMVSLLYMIVKNCHKQSDHYIEGAFMYKSREYRQKIKYGSSIGL